MGQKKGAHINWPMGDTWIGSTRYSSHLENYWPCAGGLSAVNANGTQVRGPIQLGTKPMAVGGIDGRHRAKREEKSEPASKCQIQFNLDVDNAIGGLTRDGMAEPVSRNQNLKALLRTGTGKS